MERTAEPTGRHAWHVAKMMATMDNDGYLNYLIPLLAQNRICPTCHPDPFNNPVTDFHLLHLVGKRSLECDACSYTGGVFERTMFQWLSPEDICRFLMRLVCEREHGITYEETKLDLAGASATVSPGDIYRWVRVAQQLLAMATYKALKGDVIVAFVKPSEFACPEWGIADADVDLVLLVEHRGAQGGQYDEHDEDVHAGSIRLAILPPKTPTLFAAVLQGLWGGNGKVGVQWGGCDPQYRAECERLIAGDIALIKHQNAYWKALRSGLQAGISSLGIVCNSTELWRAAELRLDAALRQITSGEGVQALHPQPAFPPERIYQAFADILMWLQQRRRKQCIRGDEFTKAVTLAIEQAQLHAAWHPELYQIYETNTTEDGMIENPLMIITKAKAQFSRFMQSAKPTALRRLFIEYAVEEFAFYRDVKESRTGSDTDRLRKLLASLGDWGTG